MAIPLRRKTMVAVPRISSLRPAGMGKKGVLQAAAERLRP